MKRICLLLFFVILTGCVTPPQPAPTATPEATQVADTKHVKPGCPYECCGVENPGDYATKTCPTGLTCKFYLCIAESAPNEYAIKDFSFERVSTKVAFCGINSRIKMIQAQAPELDMLAIWSRDNTFYAPLGNIAEPNEWNYLPNRMGFELFVASVEGEWGRAGDVKLENYFAFNSTDEAIDFVKRSVAADKPIGTSVKSPYYDKPKEQDYVTKFGYDMDTVYGYDEDYVYVHSKEDVGVSWENFLLAWHYDANYFVMFLSKSSELNPVSTLNAYNTIKQGASWSRGIHKRLMAVRSPASITADELSIAREVKEKEAEFWEAEGYLELAEQINGVAEAYKGYGVLAQEYGDNFDSEADGVGVWAAALNAEEAVTWPEFNCGADTDCALICSEGVMATKAKCVGGVCTAGQELGCWIECGAECEQRRHCGMGRACNPLTCSCVDIPQV